jgi:hypothetical protein
VEGSMCKVRYARALFSFKITEKRKYLLPFLRVKCLSRSSAAVVLFSALYLMLTRL